MHIMPTQLIRYPFLLFLPMEQTTRIEWCTAKILRRAHSAPSHRVINRAERERERESERERDKDTRPVANRSLYCISFLFDTLLLIPSLFCPFLIYMCFLSCFFRTVPLFRQLPRTEGDASHSSDHLSQIHASRSCKTSVPSFTIIHHLIAEYTQVFRRLA